MNSVGVSMQALVVCHFWHWLRVFPLEMPEWLQAVPRERWIKATSHGIPMSLITEGKLCRGTWENPEVGTVSDLLSEPSLSFTRTANLCGAFSFRSKGPTPIPSMQTQWNICSRIHDIPPEDFPNGHIKTNLFMLSATPLTTGSLTTLCPHLCWSERKIPFLIVRKWAQKDFAIFFVLLV